MLSQVTIIVRGLYSNPPSHGSSIVSTVLNDPELFQEWYVIKFCIGTVVLLSAGMRELIVGMVSVAQAAAPNNQFPEQ